MLAASLTLAPSLDLGSVITTMLPDRALTLPVDANLLKGLVTITNPQLVYVGSNLAAAKALVPAVGEQIIKLTYGSCFMRRSMAVEAMSLESA